MTRWLFIFILFISVTATYAQKEKKVTAIYTYYAPENVSIEDAKRIALDRAKMAAIADEFGTIVAQSNSTVMTTENGHADSRFLSIGGSEVKGEWIETMREPIYNIKYEDNFLVVSVEVKGRIRELVNSQIDLTTKILRNGTDEKYESNDFHSGDDMFLFFKSPIDGYLAVYLLDENTLDVFCLLPYKASGNGVYPIEHDRTYIFFSQKHDYVNPNIVDEYTMTCSKEREFNTLYIIFSPNLFAKANTNDDKNDKLPKQLTFEAFQKWVSKLKIEDNNTTIIHKQLTIQNLKK